MKKSTLGFTLVELMVVVAIIGILSAIAFPSYIQHVQKGRRAIAQGELLNFASAMEQFFVQNGSNYLVGGVAGAVPNVYSATITIDGTIMYDISVPSILASSYTLRATPRAGSPQDGNGYVQLDSAGARVWDKPGGLINYWE